MVKVCILCDSILLETALKKFLKNHITTYKECNVVLSDKKINIKKPLLIIGQKNAHIKKPFTRSTLILKLEKFEKEKLSKISLEKKIEIAALNFAKEIIKIVKENAN